MPSATAFTTYLLFTANLVNQMGRVLVPAIKTTVLADAEFGAEFQDKVGGLLATPPEQKRIPPLETNDATVSCGQLHQHRVGAWLWNGMMATTLANKMVLTALRHQVKNLSGYKGVVDQCITATQKPVGPHSE